MIIICNKNERFIYLPGQAVTDFYITEQLTSHDLKNYP